MNQNNLSSSDQGGSSSQPKGQEGPKVQARNVSSLVDYVRTHLIQGKSHDEIEKAALKAGWSQQEIARAFNLFALGRIEEFSHDEPRRAIQEENDHERKSPILKIVVAIILLILVGGGIYYYLRYLEAPTALAKMAKKMAEVKSFQFEGEANGEFSAANFNRQYMSFLESLLETQIGKDLPQVAGDVSPIEGQTQTPKENYKLKFSGSYDGSQQNNPKLNLQVSCTMKQLPIEIFSAELRSIGNTLYVKAAIPALQFFDVSEFNQQWLKVDGVNSDYVNQIGFGESDGTFFTKSKIISRIEKLPRQKVNNFSCKHYKAYLDKEKLIAAEAQRSGGQALDEQIKKYSKEYESIDNIYMEFWLGKSNLLYKALIGADIRPTNSAGIDGTINLWTSFREFGKPVTVEAPAGAKTFQELNNLYRQSVGPSQIPATPLPIPNVSPTPAV